MDIDIKNYIESIVYYLSNIYGAVLTPNQIVDIVRIAGEWLHAYGSDFYNLLKIALILKQIYDGTIGKISPVEEFGRALRLEGGAIAVSGCNANMTVTHKDGSVDSR